MLTAHLPAGFVMARLWNRPAPLAMVAALVGSVLPDLDMLWFHLVDHGAVHHHRYWPHVPLFWAVVAVVALPILWRTVYRVAGLMFFAALGVHMVLDTIAGGIMWLYPLDDRLLVLTEVPAAYSHWVISFVLHWTFLLEVAVWLWALWMWNRRGKA
jgi:inner membrane protein